VRPEAIAQLLYRLRPLYVGEVAAAGHRHVRQPDEVIWGSEDIGVPRLPDPENGSRAIAKIVVRCSLGRCVKAG